MKRYSILIVVVLMILAVAWTAFGQREGQPTERRGFGPQMSEEERAKMRERWQNMSEEERAKMRERFQNMSEEERAKMREGFQNMELEWIKAIEEQLAKLKAGIQAPGPAPGTLFRDLSEEERTKLREKFTKVREARQATIGAILAQLAKLQGRMQPPAEGEQFIIVNTADLKAVRELAVKEKAKETEDRLRAMIERPTRGFGGRTGGGGQRGQEGRPQRGAGTP